MGVADRLQRGRALPSHSLVLPLILSEEQWGQELYEYTKLTWALQRERGGDFKL